MKPEQIQNTINAPLAISALLTQLREVSGQLVLDIGRIQALGDRATDAQRGHWDNCRMARVPLSKAIYALEKAHAHLFTAGTTLKIGEMDGETVGDAPELTSTGKPLPIDPGVSNEGEEWSG